MTTVHDFLLAYVADAEDFDEIRATLRRTAWVSTHSLYRNLNALEAVLADPDPEMPLAWLVALYANWVLDDLSDAAAATFLGELAQLLRDAIDEVERPSPE